MNSVPIVGQRTYSYVGCKCAVDRLYLSWVCICKLTLGLGAPNMCLTCWSIAGIGTTDVGLIDENPIVLEELVEAANDESWRDDTAADANALAKE